MVTELIGWTSAGLLLVTIARQVYTQWRDGNVQGVSRWLFVGQLAASTGFMIYSWLLGNWVFLATNSVMAAIALLGQWLYLRARGRRAKPRVKGEASS